MCIDLHTHSVYSDGTNSPAELIKIAVDSDLHAISLTDHDTIDGIDEFLHHGHSTKIKVIQGLEICATHNKTSLHILGYGIDYRQQELNSKLSLLQRGREERNRKIITQLQKLGIDISDLELQNKSRCGQAGRPHIASILKQKKIVKTMAHAFKHYLRKGAPAWAERFTFSAAETIDMIHQAGGIAVLAHPGHIDNSMKKQPQLIRELCQRGLDGLEIYYPGHTKKIQRFFIELAKRHQLIATGGSDYHGENKPQRKLAGTDNSFCPPDSLFSNLQQRLLQGPNYKQSWPIDK